jgi:hypothetical protein
MEALMLRRKQAQRSTEFIKLTMLKTLRGGCALRKQRLTAQTCPLEKNDRNVANLSLKVALKERDLGVVTTVRANGYQGLIAALSATESGREQNEKNAFDHFVLKQHLTEESLKAVLRLAGKKKASSMQPG